MITVQQADQIILSQNRDYGLESMPFDQTLGRILAEDILADRDLPPFNRVTVDGIAIKYQSSVNGQRVFTIKATQAAGEVPVDIEDDNESVEIMTGAALPASVDTVVRYEDIEIADGKATLLIDNIEKGQNLHLKGVDRKGGDLIVAKGQVITPANLGIAASVGKSGLLVKKQPRIVVITSGDELVDVDETPSPYQLRKSNSYTVKSVLQQYGLQADVLHIPDDLEITRENIGHCLQNYDVLLLSGGISMGKFDYIPKALDELGVEKLFHKVQQRPGKPFWFGGHGDGALVFAFPGNPVATFMCLHRYFLNWFYTNNGIALKKMYAVLAEDFSFTPNLQYFLQVRLSMSEEGQLLAWPLAGNGSGDFANLADTDAFMELPAEKNEFKKGNVYRVWPFK